MVPRWSRLYLAAAALIPSAAAAADFLPPIETTGVVTYSVQQMRQASGEASLQQTGTATVNPSTYIYEPWFATTSASLSVSKTSAAGNDGASTGILTGSFNLNILPQSDYRLEIDYSRFDRSIQLGEYYSELTGQSFKAASLVRLPDGWNVSSRLQADESSDAEGLGDVSHEVGVEVDKRFTEDQMRVTLLHREATYTGGEDRGTGRSLTDSASIRYRSQPITSVTTDSTSTFRTSSYTERRFSEESSVMQGVTTALWRPGAEMKDLTVHGALRTFSQSSTFTRTEPESETGSRSTTSAFGNLASSYVFQPRLVGSANVHAGYSSMEDSSSVQTDDIDGLRNAASMSIGSGLSLDYTSLSQDISGFNWSWNTGGNLEVTQNTEIGLNHTDNLRIGHTANRKIGLWVVDNVNFSVSQNSGAGMASESGVSVPLSHAVVLSHSSREGKSWNMWHFNVSDSRTYGGYSSLYQLINMQVTEGYDPDRFTNWSASLSFQSARQVVRDTDSGMVDNVSGQVSYRHRNLFGVENLTFTSDLAINPPSILQRRREQDLSYYQPTKSKKSMDMMGSQRLTNRLNYNIGQLRTSLTSRTENNENGVNQMTLFQIARRF